MKIFKLTIVLASFILLGNTAVAQKCKLKVDKKDAISGKELKETKFVFVTDFNTLRFQKEGDQFYIYNHFHIWGENNNVVKKGQEFSLKLSNGELFKILVEEEVVGNTTVTGNLVITRWDTRCPISKEQIISISKNAPTGLSTLNFSLGKGSSIEIKEKAGKTLSEYAMCLIQ